MVEQTSNGDDCTEFGQVFSIQSNLGEVATLKDILVQSLDSSATKLKEVNMFSGNHTRKSSIVKRDMDWLPLIQSGILKP